MPSLPQNCKAPISTEKHPPHKDLGAVSRRKAKAKKPTMQHVAIYCRVSSNGQNVRSQMPDLERWAAAQDQPVRWYRDRFTGKTMCRPGWNRLQAAIDAGDVSTILCWRIDRLGRTAKE